MVCMCEKYPWKNHIRFIDYFKSLRYILVLTLLYKIKIEVYTFAAELIIIKNISFYNPIKNININMISSHQCVICLFIWEKTTWRKAILSQNEINHHLINQPYIFSFLRYKYIFSNLLMTNILRIHIELLYPKI